MPNRKEESLEEVNLKISEIKKKIQLSEGQRKAHFEDCDAEKKRNLEKIAALKKEVKRIYRKLAEPSFCEDSVLRTSRRYPKDVGPLRSKKLEEAIEFVDLKCIDLNKRLDVLKYKNKMKKLRLKKLAEEFRDVLARASDKKSRRGELSSGKPVCVLENQIHRVEMNMMEAEHVNKKYRTIRLQLMSDSVEFESSVRKLEEGIGRQETEIKHLKSINREALALRDVTKGTLLRQEISALSAGRMREAQLLEFRHRVEERRAELEKLERRISPTGRVLFEEGADGGPPPQASDAAYRSLALLQSQFAKLTAATGEPETEEVLPRFLSQKETKQRLDYLKRITEEEKKQLEMRRELITAQLEAFKFAEVKEKEESQEEIEKMNSAIASEKSLKDRHLREVTRIKGQLTSIRKFLLSLVDHLQEIDEEPPPQSSDNVNACLEVLNCLKRKLQTGLDKVGFGETLRETLSNLERNQYHHLVSDVSIRIPGGGEAPLFPGLAAQEEGKQAKAPQPSLLVPDEEDEEDVLSRAHVKRQAQLIVDAKSRKKFSRVLNFPRGKK